MDSSSMQILFPNLLQRSGGGTNGSCQIFHNGSSCTIIDLGNYDTFSSIKSAMDNAGITKIDNIIISHWHRDHSGLNPSASNAASYDHWKSAFDMSSTVFWIPNIPSMYSSTDDTYVTSSFPSNTINRVTTNGTTFTWEGITFTIYNASSADWSYYDSIPANDYNEYSFLTYAEYGNVRICNTADIGQYAQARAVEQGWVKPSVLTTIPHHGVNYVGSGEFARILRSSYAYSSNFAEGINASANDPFFGEIGKYATFYDNVTSSDDVSFRLTKDGVSPNGSAVVFTQFNANKLTPIYVDETIGYDQIQNGTQQYPYRSIRRAVAACKGHSKLQLLSDVTEAPVITASNGFIEIDGNGHSLYYITASEGGKVYVHDVSGGQGAQIIKQSEAWFYNYTTAAPVQVDHSRAWFNTYTNTGNVVAITANQAYVVIDDLITPNRATGVSAMEFTESFATGSLALGHIGNNAYVKCIRSYCDLGRLAETTAVLTNFWDHTNAPFIVYDTTKGQYARPNGSGGFRYVANA